MSPSIKAGAAYFGIVFLAGFVLGALRTLVVAPWLGQTLAVMLEAPVILAIGWFVAKECVGRFETPDAPISPLTMGGVAFALLMVAELGLSTFVVHRSIDQYIVGFQSVPGAIGLGAQIAFAGISWALKWRL